MASFTPALLGARRYVDGRPVRDSDYLQLRRPVTGTGRVYGRVVEQDDATFLEYWTWHTFNGWHYALGGLHFGDWECVVVRVRNGTPDLAAYAQHRRVVTRPWQIAPRDGDHPIVTVALGSHAAHFDRGLLANGLRRPRSGPLEVVTDHTHPWIAWPGRWGQSRDGGRWADSPRGPAHHRQWNDPAGWLLDAGAK